MCDGPASPCGGGQRLRCARPWCSHFKISASFFIAARACMARLRACFRQTAAHSANALWFASPGCDPWGATGISRSDRFQPPRLHPCCRKFIGQGVPPFPSAGVHRGRAAWPPIHPVVENDVMDGQGATPAAVSQVRYPGSGSCTLGLWRTQRGLGAHPSPSCPYFSRLRVFALRPGFPDHSPRRRPSHRSLVKGHDGLLTMD